MTECLFCKIACRELAAEIVFSNQDFVAFLDHRPVFKGHTLLVPHVHVPTLEELPTALNSSFFAATRLLARAVEVAMQAQGTFLAVNNKISQSVPHLHMHIVPRSKGDGLRGFFWPRHKYDSAEEMSDVAQRIRTTLATLS